ncbi:hypothetical protein FZC78_09495 [Rossellomorea vietnamensis]|uniref:Uncharacterized protein n=1 Tax=Rossellomorea vietnamensis TaxID=218284 RepID=A0A5D4NWG4_9BACI|nr:hypothetical protein [Rossellomorea vietnamensis]TYS18051.1 hypothetical protein FZC78_09495 [Rossellomorea vietnamensis]
MMEVKQAQKYYNGTLTFINNFQEQSEEEEILVKEKRLMEIYSFGEDSESDFAVLDDVNTLKNLMAFAEVTRYKERLLADMTVEERDEVTKRIIKNLDEFHVKPVGYEIKKDSIVVAWYLNSVINTFRFSDQSTALVD